MEYRDDLKNAETAAFEVYASMAARHTMLLLLGIATMIASTLGIVLAVAATVADVAGIADLHGAFLPVAVIGLACGGIDFISTRRDNDYIAGLATIAGQGALTAAGTIALLSWLSDGPLLIAAAAVVGIATSVILFKYPEWETQASMFDRFTRVSTDEDDYF